MILKRNLKFMTVSPS